MMEAYILLTNGDVITREFLTSIYCDEEDGTYRTYTEAEVNQLSQEVE
jgi:hypothetical protein